MSLGPGETTVQAGGEPGDGGCLAPSGPGETATQAGHEPGERAAQHRPTPERSTPARFPSPACGSSISPR